MPAGRGQFTVRVKEELAALRPASQAERRALLAALLRFAATLHIEGKGGAGGAGAAGSGVAGSRVAGSRSRVAGSRAAARPADRASRFTLVLATRSGGVARLAFWLLHAAYGVRPGFRVRRPASALAPGPRYQVVLAERVEQVLADTAILDAAGRLSSGVPGALVRGRDAAACYLRGAFLGRGSVSSPTREPHLEIGVPDERTGLALATLLARLDLPASTGARADQGSHRVLLKSGEAIGSALATMGATSAYLAWEDGRIRREVRGGAVRLANADQANLRRSVAAAMAQVTLVESAVSQFGWDALPGDVADVAALRLANPEASLAELGALLDPPRSKGAVLARLRRLQQLADHAEERT